VDTPRFLRSREIGPGTEAFHDARGRFGGSASNENLVLRFFRDASVGVVFPRRSVRSSL
jgi:hypothetical protein